MRRLLLVLVACALSGCGGLVLVDQAGKSYTGKFNSSSRRIEATIDGKAYSGVYVTNMSSSTTNAAVLGARPGYGTATTVSSGNQGRALMRAADGSTMQCDFIYEDLTAVGQCADNTGRQFQLMTK